MDWKETAVVTAVLIALSVGVKLITDPWRCHLTGTCYRYYSTPSTTPGANDLRRKYLD